MSFYVHKDGEDYLNGSVILDNAKVLTYDNTESGLKSDNIQGAIDELAKSSGAGDFENSTTVFNSDGSISINKDNTIEKTTFESDGSIVTKVYDKVTKDFIIGKSVVFNADGSITNTVLTEE